MKPTPRRSWLATAARIAAALAAARLLPAQAQAAWPRAAFEADRPADVLKALGAAAPVDSPEVRLDGPEIAENGSLVPLEIGCSAPGVRRLVLMVDKNPALLTGVYELDPMVEPKLAVRIRMAESSNVVLAAVLADGRVLATRRLVRVTIGGCAA